jgi:hypothetical protein
MKLAESIELRAHRVVVEWLRENGSFAMSILHNGELVVMNETTGEWYRGDLESLADQLQPGWGDEK